MDTPTGHAHLTGCHRYIGDYHLNVTITATCKVTVGTLARLQGEMEAMYGMVDPPSLYINRLQDSCVCVCVSVSAWVHVCACV